MLSKKKSVKSFKIITASVVLIVFGQLTMAEPVPEQYQQQLSAAQSQLHSGQGQTAYNALLSLEDQLAGYPSFDLLFGQSALMAGEGTRALMAFERCLTISPKMGDCRLGLAQAHLSLGEVQSAKEELTYIQKSAPPDAVAKVVEQYLGELSGEHRRSSKLNIWGELAVGYDDNINVAPSSSLIILPGNSLFPGAFYSASTDESMFADARLGIAYRAPVSEKWDLLMGAKVQGTFNFDADDNSYFDDITQTNAHIGAQASYGKQRVGVMAQLQNYRLSGDSYRDLIGLTGQYSYMLTPATQISSFLQYSRLDYEDDIMDTDTITAGGSLARSLMRNRLVVHGGVYAGLENRVDNQGALNKYINNEYFGLRTSVTWFWNQQLQTGINLMTEQRQYDKGFYLFPNTKRDDALFQASLNATYQLTSKLSVNTDYSYVNNDSNMPIRDYGRQMIRLGVHYDFL